jgi:hypothetical protein
MEDSVGVVVIADVFHVAIGESGERYRRFNVFARVRRICTGGFGAVPFDGQRGFAKLSTDCGGDEEGARRRRQGSSAR